MQAILSSKANTLTKEHRKFAELVAQGSSLAEAYRNAVVHEGDTSAKTIYQQASKLAKIPKIRNYIEEMKIRLQQITDWTRADSAQVLIDIAMSQVERTADRIAAVKELNIMHGYNAPIEHRHEVTGTITRIELVVPSGVTIDQEPERDDV